MSIDFLDPTGDRYKPIRNFVVIEQKRLESDSDVEVQFFKMIGDSYKQPYRIKVIDHSAGLALPTIKMWSELLPATEYYSKFK